MQSAEAEENATGGSWDAWSVFEDARRPLAWSKSSVIFSAHATRPLVDAHHFPSSRKVVIPQPTKIQTSPTPFDYRPPSIVSLSPCDLWLFAFFPSTTADGLGCLWRRGEEVDHWAEKESFFFLRGADPVAASWVGGPREWTTYTQQAPSRLPWRGPRLPYPDPALVLVTQDLQVMTCFHKCSLAGMRTLRCSLLEPASKSEQFDILEVDVVEDALSAASKRIAVNAAIGTTYGESSILVAVQLAVAPAPVLEAAPFISMAMENSFMDVPGVNDTMPIEWGIWGVQHDILLCHVDLSIDLGPAPGQAVLQSSFLTLTTQPNLSVKTSGGRLTNLHFLASPPTPPATVGSLHLVASFAEFHESLQVSSDMFVYSITRSSITPPSNAPGWSSQFLAKRRLEQRIVSFCSPWPPLSIGGKEATPLQIIVAATLVGDAKTTSSGDRPRRRGHFRGDIRILSLTDLQDVTIWRPSPMLTATHGFRSSAFAGFAISPNGSLLGTTSLDGVQIHALPWSSDKDSDDDLTSRMSAMLRKSIEAHYNPADILHYLAQAPASAEDVYDGLSRALATLGSDVRFNEFAGAFLGLDKASSSSSPLKVRPSGVVLDFCSVSSCNHLFLDYQEDESGFDLDAVWHLVGACKWFCDFFERVAKECCFLSRVTVESTPAARAPIKNEEDDDLFGSAPPTPAPVDEASPQTAEEPTRVPLELLFLVHPMLLKDVKVLTQNVVRLKNQVSTATPGSERARLAQLFLVELVGSLGVDLAALLPVLDDLLSDAEGTDQMLLRRSLAASQLVPELHAAVIKAAAKLENSPALDRMQLFLKGADLMDGGLPFPAPAETESNIDIVTKEALDNTSTSVCVRCGGRSRTVTVRTNPGRLLWWNSCICGGDWRRA